MSNAYGVTHAEVKERIDDEVAAQFRTLEDRLGMRTGETFLFGNLYRVAIRVEGPGAPEARMQSMQRKAGAVGYGADFNASTRLMAAGNDFQPEISPKLPSIQEIMDEGQYRIDVLEDDLAIIRSEKGKVAVVVPIAVLNGRAIAVHVVPVYDRQNVDLLKEAAKVDTTSPMNLTICAATRQMFEEYIRSAVERVNARLFTPQSQLQAAQAAKDAEVEEAEIIEESKGPSL